MKKSAKTRRRKPSPELLACIPPQYRHYLTDKSEPPPPLPSIHNGATDPATYKEDVIRRGLQSYKDDIEREIATYAGKAGLSPDRVAGIDMNYGLRAEALSPNVHRIVHALRVLSARINLAYRSFIEEGNLADTLYHLVQALPNVTNARRGAETQEGSAQENLVRKEKKNAKAAHYQQTVDMLHRQFPSLCHYSVNPNHKSLCSLAGKQHGKSARTIQRATKNPRTRARKTRHNRRVS